MAVWQLLVKPCMPTNGRGLSFDLQVKEDRNEVSYGTELNLSGLKPAIVIKIRMQDKQN